MKDMYMLKLCKWYLENSRWFWIKKPIIIVNNFLYLEMDI